jgi:hypothetical protein
VTTNGYQAKVAKLKLELASRPGIRVAPKGFLSVTRRITPLSTVGRCHGCGASGVLATVELCDQCAPRPAA